MLKHSLHWLIAMTLDETFFRFFLKKEFYENWKCLESRSLENVVNGKTKVQKYWSDWEINGDFSISLMLQKLLVIQTKCMRLTGRRTFLQLTYAIYKKCVAE